VKKRFVDETITENLAELLRMTADLKSDNIIRHSLHQEAKVHEVGSGIHRV